MHRDKSRFTKRFRRHQPLRLHMSLILAATALSGLLTTRGLLAAGVDSIVVRYPLAVLFSYLIFFILIKLWLKYLDLGGKRESRQKKSSLLDAIDIPLPGSGGGPVSGSGGSLSGGGGQFSGAGASGSFDHLAIIGEGPGSSLSEMAGSAGEGLLEGTGAAVEQGGEALDVVGDVAGEAVGGILESDVGVPALVALAVIGAVVAVVMGAGIYMIYEAPFILSEAAFEVVLATALVRSSRTINSPDWIGSVFRTTSIPFGISLLVAWGGALLIHSRYPEVTRLSELALRILH